MPSPVGHTLLGLGIYTVWCRNLRQWLYQWKIILWVVICANLPDIDFIPGLLQGDMSRYHQTYTHTLGFALVVTVVTFIVLKIRKVKNCLSVSLLTFTIVFTHIILDTLTCDSRPPIGSQLFWPFSCRYFHFASFFSPVPHSGLSDIFDPLFIKAIAREIILIGIPVVIVMLWKWKRPAVSGR